MAHSDLNEYNVRLQKLAAIREMGKTPYASQYKRTHTSKKALELGAKGGLREVNDIVKKKTDKTIKLSGRIMTFRSHGKIAFANLQDFDGQIQICFMQDLMGKDDYKFLKKVDMADFVGVEGELFVTRHGDITLLVYEVTMLSKALRPLPEKWHGLNDKEAIYRQPYLNLIMSRESMDKAIFRSKFVQSLREFYWQEGFYEIETPILENISSGATAKPFSTHHNALDIDVYLRIAGGELWHKSAIVGGFENVFEIGKCFRNEGIDPSHLQEFTMVEHYSAYWNYEDNMEFTEKLFEYVLNKTLGTTKVMIKGRDGEETEVDFKGPWPRKKITELIEEDCGINIENFTDEKELLAAMLEKNIKIEKAVTLGFGGLVDALYKKVSRPKLIQPTFVTHHPIDMKPLARMSDDNSKVCDSFQLLVNTWEVVNAYSEITDPIDQRKRFETQALAKANGDEEAMMMNEDYLRTMEHGMPTVSGWGMGIDRMVTLLTGQENLKDCVLFPLLKPIEKKKKKKVKKDES